MIAITMNSSQHGPVSWPVAIVKGVTTAATVFGGFGGLLIILVTIGAVPEAPTSPLIERLPIIGVGALIALLAAGGLICAYGRGQRSMRVRLGGLIVVDAIFATGVVLFRLLGT